MRKKIVTWIVVADGSRARIFVASSDGSGLALRKELSSDDARKPTRDLGTDRPGRVASRGRRSGMEPRADRHKQAKDAFLASVAAEIDRGATPKGFDRLVLVAAARALTTLRNGLGAAARAKVWAEVRKDLTKTPAAELREHLGEAITL